MATDNRLAKETKCYHCGDDLSGRHHHTDGHQFCCLGCQTVYQVLHSSNMQQYYRYNTHPGKKKTTAVSHYEYLDESAITDKLIDYKDGEITIVTFFIPVIHCSSCIWLLERLYRLHPGIVSSKSDFLKKQVTITFRQHEISLRGLVQLLVDIGYEPKITLQDVVKEARRFSQKPLVAKIAVAGFCFGNSMMLSFPEYFGMAAFEARYAVFFGWMNLAFALPALLYSGRDYFHSAWQSLRQRQLNLDVPLALGIAVLFIRTAWEVVTVTGPGFADTLCGLVFFLLVGRWVQQRTYHHISFERDYRSYFPVAVTRIGAEGEKPVPISELKVGDRILVRNGEIVPADAMLLNGSAAIDFSFVTGESAPVEKVLGEIIYAGGRQTGEALELEVVRPVSQSHLTKLWNNEAFKPYERRFRTFSNTISRYFTMVLLTIAVLATAFWLVNGDSARAWGAFTAVLIIACPCALALSSPFTLSAALGIFDRNHIYIKNAAAIEQLAAIDCLVFDKTGTISSPKAAEARFDGELTDETRSLVASACRQSGHPLSREIVNWIGHTSIRTVTDYREQVGKGIRALVDGHQVSVGSFALVGGAVAASDEPEGSTVYVKIDGSLIGRFVLRQPWRKELAKTLGKLAAIPYAMHLVSGDNDRDRKTLQSLFPGGTDLLFNRLPANKLDYIRTLQSAGRSVCMFGDGLNDAGALKQADMGIAVSDDINNFSPGCDAILDGQSFSKLPRFLRFSKDTVKVIHRSFGISLSYNIVGLSFAVMGTMSPLFAAVLMPLSTVTIIVFTTLATRFYAVKRGLITRML